MTNVYRNYRDPNDPSSTLKRVHKQGSIPHNQKALVIEVILDPYNLTEEQRQAIKDVTQKNKDLTSLADMMPPNSIIGRIVNDSGGLAAQTNMIIMPWFSSHIMFPVKPGEIVNVIFDDYQNTGTQMPFWISRRTSPGTIEDVNYTHHDRIFQATNNPENYSLADRTKTESNTNTDGPGFPNGGGTERSKTIEIPNVKDPYEEIKNRSNIYPLHVTEPVPRFKKKPGDFVFQGSNNTLICLGEDRQGSIDNEENTKAFSGTIDIVAGRGRNLPATDLLEPEGTAPRIIKNSRGEFETDKAPFVKGFNSRKHNPNEGNPDFETDAARLYVSMQTKADEKFGLQLNPQNSLSLPDLSGDGTNNRSHVVGKADHVRLIARNNDNPNIKGTLLLIREGAPNVDLGYIYIDENGEIQLESEKIYLGEATEEAEPSILYTNYEETILSLQEQIEELQSQIKSIGQTLTNAVGNLGGSIPSFVSDAPDYINFPSSQQTKIKTVRQNTEKTQHSLKTFNEPNPNRK